MNRFVLSIRGREYRLRSDLPEELLQELVRVFHEKAETLDRRYPGLPDDRFLVLLALEFAEAWVTERAQIRDLTRWVREAAENAES